MGKKFIIQEVDDGKLGWGSFLLIILVVVVVAVCSNR